MSKEKLNKIIDNCTLQINDKINRFNVLNAKVITEDITLLEQREKILIEGEINVEKKIRNAVIKLSFAIDKAYKEVSEYTEGMEAAILFIESYSIHLMKKEKKLEDITDMVKKCSTALDLLTKDINFRRVDLGAGKRIISALQGVGFVLSGMVLGFLALPATICTLFAESDNDDGPGLTESMWGYIGNLFVKAFDSFKETCTGKEEPPQLKKLSHQLQALKKRYSPVPTVSESRFAFHHSNSDQGSNVLQNINEHKKT